MVEFLTRYTVRKVVDRWKIHDAHTEEPPQLSFDSETAAAVCARLANAIEAATVAHLESWLVA